MEKYPPLIAELVSEKRLNLLGPGSPNPAAGSKLKGMTVDKLFAPRKVRDPNMARACLAGLWLYHDYLDEGHNICQDIDTPSGSFWHGIMHRREPDYGNAKYWFRRVNKHEIFPELHQAAARLAAEDGDPAGQFLARATSWDPFAFIDLCEAVQAGQAPCELLCRRIQAREWELLFDFCFRHAVQP